MTAGYYEQGLAAERLQRCYEIAPPRTRQYLEAELEHVVSHVHRDDIVLELGCGYGRILPALCRKARLVVGIDSSRPSIELASKLLAALPNCRLFEMNAIDLRFPDGLFDKVVCIQNGISAFQVDQRALIREAARVTREGGLALFSTYSDRFWEHRLEWFRLQAEAGLVGPIDWSKTRDGTIVCTDGFTATTVGPERLREFAATLNLNATIVEVDESSLFCELTRTGPRTAV